MLQDGSGLIESLRECNYSSHGRSNWLQNGGEWAMASSWITIPPSFHCKTQNCFSEGKTIQERRTDPKQAAYFCKPTAHHTTNPSFKMYTQIRWFWVDSPKAEETTTIHFTSPFQCNQTPNRIHESHPDSCFPWFVTPTLWIHSRNTKPPPLFSFRE